MKFDKIKESAYFNQMSDKKQKMFIEYIKERDENFQPLSELIYNSMCLSLDDFLSYLKLEGLNFTLEWFKEHIDFIRSDSSFARLFNYNRIYFC